MRLTAGQPPISMQTLTVCKEGPPTCDYATVQEAVEAAQPFANVRILPGTYQENVIIDKSLNLIAYETGGVRLQGLEPGRPTLTLRPQGPFHVTLSGFTILGGPPALEEEASPNAPACRRDGQCPDGIFIDISRASGSFTLSLLHVQVLETERSGIFCEGETVEGAAYVTIQGSRFFTEILWFCNPGRGTLFQVSHTEFLPKSLDVGVDFHRLEKIQAEFSNTSFIGGLTGLSFSQVKGAQIRVVNSRFQGSTVGLGFQSLSLEESASSLVVKGSYFLGNADGLGLRGMLVDDTTTVTVQGSVFAGNLRYGLSLENYFRTAIEGNVIQDNGIGIEIFKSPNVLRVDRNRITRNRDWGVALGYPPCQANPGESYLIEGEANEIYDNGKGDLCPPDYNWPEGFTMP